MSLDRFANFDLWTLDVNDFINHIDTLPLHYVMHIMHGAEILAYKHPLRNFRDNWKYFYLKLVENFHLNPETEEEMDARLNDNE